MEDNHNYISDEELAAFLDGNASPEDAERILESIGSDPELAEILALSPEIDEQISTERLQILPIRALAAANADNLCSFECEMHILEQQGVDVDHLSLLQTAKANNWLREEGTPLHHVGRLLELAGMSVKRSYDASTEDISRALAEGKYAIVVIGMEDDPGRLHAVSVDASTVIDKTFLESWRKSGNYLVVASESFDDYDPQPIDVEDIDLDASLEELTEAIAENAHDIWARRRLDEGWRYGPVRDDLQKTHPDLVPYSKLPEKEKEYDRQMAMNTLRLVRRLGFDVRPADEL